MSDKPDKQEQIAANFFKDHREFLDPVIGFERGFRFSAHGATIENHTSRFIYFVSAGVYIPPYTYGRTIALPGTNKGQAVWQAPPSIPQPAAIAGELAWVVFWEEAPVPVLTSVSDHITTTPQLYSTEFDYDASGNLLYFGQATPGSLTTAAVWQIRSFVGYSGTNPLTMLWADGTPAFTKTWTLRATYSYS